MTIKTLLAHKNLWLVVASCWTSIILFLCLVNSSDLPSLSLKINGIDKVVHFSFHFIFTFLWVIYLRLAQKSIPKSQIQKVILASFIFGIFIEVLQGLFTLTRKADVLDVLANTLGAITAGILIYFIVKQRNKLKTQ